VNVYGDHFVQDDSYLLLSDGSWNIPEFTVVSATHGVFTVPDGKLAGVYSIQVATKKSRTVSDAQIGLHLIKLPEIHRLLPEEVP